MKILLVNKFFYMNGGSERVYFQERTALLGAGHEVKDFAMEDKRNLPSPCSKFFVPNIDYYGKQGIRKKIQQSVAFIHSKDAVQNLEKLVKEEAPEIAHLHNIYHQLTPSLIPILKKHGIKVVMTIHDYKLVCPAYSALNENQICTACGGRHFWKPTLTNCQGSLGKGLLLTLEAFFHKWRKSYEAVDFFISPSEFLAGLVMCRIPKEKIKVVRNGIDTMGCQPHYGDLGYVIYFGRLAEEKGIETLLKAYATLESVMPLKVIGTGPLERELRSTYPKVEFLGYKNGQDLKHLVAHAAFVVVPSEWYENCSMAVLEAMALGKPVIGSRIGGIPEQVHDGKTGFLFEMGNVGQLAEKIAILVSNSELRYRMGMAARERLEREYSLTAHCDGLLDIYSELLGREVRNDVPKRSENIR